MSSEQDIRARAREALERRYSRMAQPGSGITVTAERLSSESLAALEAEGIALVDAGFECVSRGYTDHVEARMRNDAATIAERDAEIAALVEFVEADDGSNGAIGGRHKSC